MTAEAVIGAVYPYGARRLTFNHSRADVGSFFSALDMVGPGVGEAHTWRAWQREPVWRRRDGHVLAGVGRVPEPGTGGGGR
jgi:hypothetical protein